MMKQRNLTRKITPPKVRKVILSMKVIENLLMMIAM